MFKVNNNDTTKTWMSAPQDQCFSHFARPYNFHETAPFCLFVFLSLYISVLLVFYLQNMYMHKRLLWQQLHWYWHFVIPFFKIGHFSLIMKISYFPCFKLIPRHSCLLRAHLSPIQLRSVFTTPFFNKWVYHTLFDQGLTENITMSGLNLR